ncbi:MAG: hypothetical protein ABIW76_20540 [Fibrobacteria bacterium]
MTKIILLVIAFQVVMGILAKRKAAKKAAEASRDARTGGSAPAGTGPASANAPTAWGGGHSEDESEEEWDEHHRREEGEIRPDTRARHRRLPDESIVTGHGRKPQEMREDAREIRDIREGASHETREGSGPAARKPSPAAGKAADLGKDLLSQLARELGLDLPTGNRPAPRAPQPSPRPQPAGSTAPSARTVHPAKAAAVKASATQAAREAAASARMALERDKDRHTEISRRAAMDAQARAARDQSGENAPRRDPRNFSATPAPAPAMRSASATARANLMDVKSLRNAFILKTILDKPLSLNPLRQSREIR